MSEKVDRKDIQGLLASGYDHLDHASFIFLQVTNSAKARCWLASVADKVITAEHPGSNKANNCFNLALTFKGIEALGVAGDSIKGFSHEFTQGMNRPEAAAILGDNGLSEQRNWEFGASETQRDKPIHILVLLYAECEKSMHDFMRDLDLIAPELIGLQQIYRQDTSRKRGDRTEPFGFRDGISQPSVIGLVGKRTKGDLIKTGEFVLGYQDEKRLKSQIPAIDVWHDPAGYLADHPDYPNDQRAFGLNGTYLVFRKLSQDVKRFWDYVDSQTGSDPQRRELLAAKMVGRWRSGAPLVLAPKKPGAEPINEFLYTPTDPDGLACPIGSHIRRVNPRDSLPTWPSRSLDISNRHRIIRRGRKYRIPIDGDEQECRDQGICFIALNADLLRQFEFIQYTWLNNPQFNGLDNDKDPIAGDSDGHTQFTIQATPINCHVRGVPRFVTMKGGGYFFLPGIRTLRFLAHYEPARGRSQSAQPSSSPADVLSRPQR
jgi:Dyp-type peroxidase family